MSMKHVVRGVAALVAAVALLFSAHASGGSVTAGGWCLDANPATNGPCPTSPKPPTGR
jgi:hypothetical protein